MVQGTSSLKYFLPVAQESLSAIKAWVFYCQSHGPIGTRKGREGLIISHPEQIQILFCLALYIFPLSF